MDFFIAYLLPVIVVIFVSPLLYVLFNFQRCRDWYKAARELARERKKQSAELRSLVIEHEKLQRELYELTLQAMLQAIDEKIEEMKDFLAGLKRHIVDIGSKGTVFSKQLNRPIPATVIHICRNGSYIVDTPRGPMRKRRFELEAH